MVRRPLLALALGLVVALVAFPRPAFAFPELQPVATGLAFPTNLAFASDGRVFFTEKDTGNVRVLEDGALLPQPFATFAVDTKVNETGLLGIALHPDFPEEPWVYVYYSDPAGGRNRLVRVRADGDVGVERETLLDLLPTTNGWHNGGDMTFGPDGDLYLVTGDGHVGARAQDPQDLGGKVLRLDPDGTIPADNPFGPDAAAYAIGIRNSFGLCFDPTSGDLWETENGPSSHDEVNLIEAAANYGWPEQLGPGGEPTFVDPVLDFPEEIVPTGCAVVEGALWFGDAGGNLHRATIASDGVSSEETIATFPSLVTDVARAPDGSLWVATSDAIYRTELAGPSASGAPTSRTVTPAPTAAPAERPTGVRSGAGVIILLVLIGGLLLVRARLSRRSGG